MSTLTNENATPNTGLHKDAVDYRTLPKASLIVRCRAYANAIHQLAGTATKLKNENHTLRERLKRIEQNRRIFAEGSALQGDKL